MQEILYYKGFHTNSSSSHSLILMEKEINKKICSEDRQFGWDYFVLTTRKCKFLYMLALYYQLNDVDIKKEKWIQKYIKEFKLNIDELIIEFKNDDYYIDHNSIPYHTQGIRLTPETICKIIENDRIMIMGGNDNNSNSNTERIINEVLIENSLDPKNVVYKLDMDDLDEDNLRFKNFMRHLLILEKGKDYEIEENKYYKTIFIPKNNLLIIKSDTINSIDELFDKYKENNKTDIPIFVDLNISDYCIFDCQFCYQNNNSQNNIVTYNEILKMLNVLDKLKVKQVALGGGYNWDFQFEKLWSNVFIKYLNDFDNDKKKMILNYTFRDVKTLIYIQQHYDEIKELIKYMGLGISVENYRDFYNTVTLINNIDKDGKLNVTFHIIAELWSITDLDRIFFDYENKNKYSFLLLGFKRPHDESVYNYDDIISKYSYSDLSTRIVQCILYDQKNIQVDTLLLNRIKPYLDNNEDIKDKGYKIKNIWSREGLISKYIDMPNKRIYKSSYEKNNYVEYDKITVKNIRKCLTTFFG